VFDVWPHALFYTTRTAEVDTTYLLQIQGVGFILEVETLQIQYQAFLPFVTGL
jgi:hypothetical protein